MKRMLSLILGIALYSSPIYAHHHLIDPVELPRPHEEPAPVVVQASTPEVSADGETGNVTVTTTGTATIEFTGTMFHDIVTGANYYHTCGDSDSLNNASGGTISTLGSSPSGSWAVVGTSHQFGNNTSIDVLGHGYGVTWSGSGRQIDVDGVGQVTINVEYSIAAEFSNAALGHYAEAKAWIDVNINSMSNADTQIVYGTVGGASQSGVLSISFNVNGPAQHWLDAATELRANGEWDDVCN